MNCFCSLQPNNTSVRLSAPCTKISETPWTQFQYCYQYTNFREITTVRHRFVGNKVIFWFLCVLNTVLPHICKIANKIIEYVWLGGVVVKALDLHLEIAGSSPAAALSSETLDKLFTHIVQRLWCYNLMALYINQFEFFFKLARVNGKNSEWVSE